MDWRKLYTDCHRRMLTMMANSARQAEAIAHARDDVRRMRRVVDAAAEYARSGAGHAPSCPASRGGSCTCGLFTLQASLYQLEREIA